MTLQASGEAREGAVSHPLFLSIYTAVIKEWQDKINIYF
jgi:hypothetical protein